MRAEHFGPAPPKQTVIIGTAVNTPPSRQHENPCASMIGRRRLDIQISDVRWRSVLDTSSERRRKIEGSKYQLETLPRVETQSQVRLRALRVRSR
jgi:hypothetical protein